MAYNIFFWNSKLYMDSKLYRHILSTKILRDDFSYKFKTKPSYNFVSEMT